MNNYTNLSELTNYKLKKTYFIHIKKNNTITNDKYLIIKKLLDENIIDNIDNIDINNFRFINKSELKNKSYKFIGKYLKSNKVSICKYCKLDILPNTIFKQLNCSHRFHIHCIDLKLKQNIYKQCIFCNTEQITSII